MKSSKDEIECARAAAKAHDELAAHRLISRIQNYELQIHSYVHEFAIHTIVNKRVDQLCAKEVLALVELSDLLNAQANQLAEFRSRLINRYNLKF